MSLLQYGILLLVFTSSVTALSLLQSVAQSALNTVESVSQTALNTAGSVSSNVFAAAADPVLSLCPSVKDILGLSYAEMVEREPNLDNLTVNYISRDHNETYSMATAPKDILAARYYNTSQKLYIFVHGWSVDPKNVNSTYSVIKQALYDSGKNNVLALDASMYIESDYLQSSTYAIFIGRKLADVLIGLNDEGLSPAKVHMIGHSLGAHTAGFAGKSFRNATGTNIGRISGLDPAGPCFTDTEADSRLSATDADFVDVIHTNGGLKGTTDIIGQVDFHPNGGVSQTGCLSTSCSHNRVVKLYAESIANSAAFPAVKCDSWIDFKLGNCDDNDVIDYSVSYNVSTAVSDLKSDTNYSPKEKLYVVVHGWNSDPGSVKEITTALLKNNHRVLALNASQYLSDLFYMRTTIYVYFIGHKLGQLLVGLNKAGLDRTNIHIIGHSLGGQISSYAGKTFHNLTSTKVSRISALDPAGPCFEELPESLRINPTDAEFVDAVHTNAGIYGINKVVGHVDFYPNGGKSQENCTGSMCSHIRAIDLFAESITHSEDFLAAKCDSWDDFKNGLRTGNDTYMGINCAAGTTGTYYLRTNTASLYGLGTLGTTVAATKSFWRNIMSFFG